MENKPEKLREILKEMGSVLVAFSGGLDSTFLLKTAHEVLGDKACALTATSPAYSQRELDEARRFCETNSIKQIVVESNETNIPEFRFNAKDRCYHCKKDLFSICLEHARQLSLACVADGHNASDLTDYRPGSKAALELGIRRPLLEAGMSKEDIRRYSREAGLTTWEKPSYACLASRFPYGTEITPERLKRVEELENFLKDEGFSQVRVRFHGNTARIEVIGEDFVKFMESDLRDRVTEKSLMCGFIYTAVDLKGYRTGSMNES